MANPSAANSTAPTASLAAAPCSDWAQCFVLELVTHYQPASEEERFDILEASCSFWLVSDGRTLGLESLASEEERFDILTCGLLPVMSSLQGGHVIYLSLLLRTLLWAPLWPASWS